jgi:poly [ADP-ribose] polymerase
MMVIKEWRGIKTDIRTNENKFWQGYLYSDGRVESHFGRVGDAGQRRELGHGEALFEAKCREKAKKGYVEQKTLNGSGTITTAPIAPKDLAQVAKSQIQSNSTVVERLIKKLADANVHAILESTTLSYNASTGAFATPLGIVTEDALQEARTLLTTIGDCVSREAYNDARLLPAVNRFFTLVPQDFGRRRQGVQNIFPDAKAVQERIDIIDRLETSLQMALSNASSPNKAMKRVFEAQVNLVEDSDEFFALNRKFKSSLNAKHVSANLKLRRAYSVEIASMKKAYETKSASINNVMELWHGTNTGNILSILKDGFKVQPPATAAITGKNFGNGIYFGIQSSKSLNYSFGYWSGTRHTTCHLFLCEVAVGRYQVPNGATSKRPDKGYNSYWAKPSVSGVVNDEIVIFDEAQINPRYLLEFVER